MKVSVDQERGAGRDRGRGDYFGRRWWNEVLVAAAGGDEEERGSGETAHDVRLVRHEYTLETCSGHAAVSTTHLYAAAVNERRRATVLTMDFRAKPGPEKAAKRPA